MITYLDIIKGIHTGRICSERDFDLRVFAPKLKEALKAHEIKYDPEEPVPDDDGLADDLWSAAMDFYRNVGTYCLDTERIVQFDENEIAQTLKTAPREFTFGEEKQRKLLTQRRPEDRTPPWCFLGAGGAAVSSEENLLRLVQGYASIPVINSLTSPALTTVDGMRIVGGSPLEMYGAIRAVGLARQALSRAGKPGLPIMNCISTASSAIADFDGFRRFNKLLLQRLIDVSYGHDIGTSQASLACTAVHGIHNRWHDLVEGGIRHDD